MSLWSGKSYLKEFPTPQDESIEDRAAGSAGATGREPPSTVDIADRLTMSQDPFQMLDTKSQLSRSIRSLQRSSASSTAAKAYAKAKAARAQLIYAEKEANMMKQKAQLEASMLKQRGDYEASLHLLQCQKAAAAAEAEASAYEEVESGELSQIEDEPLNTVQRTTDYVHQQSKSIFSELPVKYRDGESLE